MGQHLVRAAGLAPAGVLAVGAGLVGWTVVRFELARVVAVAGVGLDAVGIPV